MHARHNADLAVYRRIAAELPHGAVFVVDRAPRHVVAQGSELESSGFSPLHVEGRTAPRNGCWPSQATHCSIRWKP